MGVSEEDVFLVADAEAGKPENTYRAHLFLSVPYLFGVGRR